jgi:hypothetical protein
MPEYLAVLLVGRIKMRVAKDNSALDPATRSFAGLKQRDGYSIGPTLIFLYRHISRGKDRNLVAMILL